MKYEELEGDDDAVGADDDLTEEQVTTTFDGTGDRRRKLVKSRIRKMEESANLTLCENYEMHVFADYFIYMVGLPSLSEAEPCDATVMDSNWDENGIEGPVIKNAGRVRDPFDIAFLQLSSHPLDSTVTAGALALAYIDSAAESWPGNKYDIVLNNCADKFLTFSMR